MKHTKKIATLLITLLVTLSSLVAQTQNSSIVINELTPKVSPYYEKYTKALSEGKTAGELRLILDEWNRTEQDADSFKYAFQLYEVVANEANDPNILYEGLTILKKSILIFPNRFDLWALYVQASEKYSLNDLTSSLLTDFLVISDEIQKQGKKWYTSFNEPLVFEDGMDYDKFAYNFMFTHTIFMSQQKDFDNARKVLDEMMKKWPDNSSLLSEYGYTYIFVNPKKALDYCEKAYKLDNNNKDALIYSACAAKMKSDKKLLKKYDKMIRATKDNELIALYEKVIDEIKFE